MIFLALLISAVFSVKLDSVVRYVFPMWDMNIYDTGIVSAKKNLTELNTRLEFYSLMQKITLGHTIASSIGTICMATVACVAAPIPGTIGAVSFGIYSVYHAALKGLSSVEITQSQYNIKELLTGEKLKGKFVQKIYAIIPDIFYHSDILGFALVLAVAWGVWIAKIHQIQEWRELRRVIGMLSVVLIALICIGFMQTIHSVERQEIGRKEWLETEINNRCNVLKMEFMRRLRYEVMSLMGAVKDEDGYIHNSECDALTDEYRIIRGDLITIAVKCFVRVLRGAVIQELFGEMSWITKLMLFGALAVIASLVIMNTLGVHAENGAVNSVIGPALRVAAIGLIILLFMRMFSII